MGTDSQRFDPLPPPVTSFVGRQVDRAELGGLVTPGALVTLTGSGGSGKSRLAVEVARDRLAAGGGEACLVRLTAVQEPRLVASAVAVALGIREEPGRPLERVVVDRLRTEELLLLLDNCEHVLDGVRPLVEALLVEARGVALLATSREPLHLDGEQVWPLAPLQVPQRTTDPDEVTASPAGRLFLDRASRARPDFVLEGDAPGYVAALCRQLGGLPLAIELVAPWVRLLGVRELHEHAEELLRVPSPAGGRGHHRSVEAALDWSYELLTEPQRTLFRHVSVFAGGFTLEAVEALEADVRDGADVGDGPAGVLQTLAALVDKGLVLADVDGAGSCRYRLLEPVRQYAARLLDDSGGACGVRGAHLRFFLDLAITAARHLHTDEQVPWLARLDAEHANLRAADDWAMAAGRPEDALQLGGALQHYWWVRGHVEDGPWRLQRALEATPDSTDRAARARALVGLGAFLLVAGHNEWADRVVAEGAGLYRELGHARGLARALGTRTRIAYNRGDVEASERYGSEALRLYEELGNDGGIAWMLIGLGGPAAARGDRERHRRLIDEAAEHFISRGDRWGMGWVFGMQGAIRLIEDDPTGARGLLDRSLDRFAEIGNRDAAAVRSLAVRAIARTRSGDLAGARDDVTEALELGLRTGDHPSLAYAVTAAADVAATEGHPVTAAETLGAAEATTTVASYVRTDLAADIAKRLRRRLDDAALESAMGRGRARPASEVLDAVAAAAAGAPNATAGGWEPGPPATPPTVPGAGLLVREGEYWTVKLDGETTRIRDLKGLRYLAHLLAHPGREFHVLDLVSEVERVPVERMDRSDTGPLLDARAKADFRRRLEELEEELTDAEELGDEHRAERARGEREHLALELAGAVGLGGRDRRAGAASERARVNVTRLIGTVLAKLGEDCPTLAHLLRSTVRTGTYCAYEPPPDGGPQWSL